MRPVDRLGVLASVAGKKKPNYRPVDAERIAELRAQEGLTERGATRLARGDVRCRPPKSCREAVGRIQLSQFRLRDAICAARGEDMVVVWAHVTGREAIQDGSSFCFDPQTYMQDASLVEDLKKIDGVNVKKKLEAYIKSKYGTTRQLRLADGEEEEWETATATTTTTGTTGTGTAAGDGQSRAVLMVAMNEAGTPAPPPPPPPPAPSPAAASTTTAGAAAQPQPPQQLPPPMVQQQRLPPMVHQQQYQPLPPHMMPQQYQQQQPPPHMMPHQYQQQQPPPHMMQQYQPPPPHMMPQQYQQPPPRPMMQQCQQPPPRPTMQLQQSPSPRSLDHQLRAVDLKNRLSIGAAFKMLYDNDIGGPLMRWVAAQAAFGTSVTMTTEQLVFLFETTRDYVLRGEYDKVTEWVDSSCRALVGTRNTKS